MGNCGKWLYLISFIVLFTVWFAGFISIIKFLIKRRNTWYEYRGAKYRLILLYKDSSYVIVENEKGERIAIPKKELVEFVPVKRK